MNNCTDDQPGSEIQFLLTPFYAQQQNVNLDRLCKYVMLCCRAFLGRLRGFSISEGLFGPGFSKSGAKSGSGSFIQLNIVKKRKRF